MGLFDREPVICPICGKDVKESIFKKRKLVDGVVCGTCFFNAGRELKDSVPTSELKQYTVEKLRGYAEAHDEKLRAVRDFPADLVIGKLEINTKERKWNWKGSLTDTITCIPDSTTLFDIFDFDDVQQIEASCGTVMLGGDTTVTNNGLGRAVVGGLLAGSTGALVGASTAKQTVHQEVKSVPYYSIYVKLKPYPGRKWILDFDNAADVQKAMDVLGEDLKQRELLAQQKNAQIAAPAPDPAEELRKYKALLDEGVITQQEFDAKKKQLLAL